MTPFRCNREGSLNRGHDCDVLLLKNVAVLLFLLLAGQATSSASANVQLSNAFPSLSDTTEMAALSCIVYSFRDLVVDEEVCEQINKRNFTSPVLEDVAASTPDIKCHWYHHSRVIGTQVMIVSSAAKRYNAVVFAGTDDPRTALTDATIFMEPFGDESLIWQVPPDVKVHKGFNDGVFQEGLFSDIKFRLDDLIAQNPDDYRVVTTGHSLGAAEAIFVAVGLTLEYQSQHPPLSSIFRKWWPWSKKKKQESHHVPKKITTINFGCPRTGSSRWRDYIHSDLIHDDPVFQNLAIWRIVLGWDLVPRLPDFFSHVGHTVQILKSCVLPDCSGTINITAQAYYQHYGDPKLGLAGVPLEWYSMPYFWVPGALLSHHVYRYWSVLNNWTLAGADQEWITAFVPATNQSHDDRPPNVDDDLWVNPPDDQALLANDGYEEDQWQTYVATE